MKKHLIFLLIVLTCRIGIAQQVVPSDGTVITSTSVLFEVPEVIGAINYAYRIKSEKGSLIELTDKNHVVRIDGLSFGAKYSWEVDALDASGGVLHSYSQQFTIATSSLIDPTKNRFPVIGSSKDKEVNGVLFLDYSKVAITPEGMPVWFMPERESLKNKRLRDFKLTNRGTLTYLDITYCEEMSLDGHSIWMTPSDGQFSGDTTDYYHHEFTRLSNGNYMALGKQFVESDLTISGKKINRLPLSIIIEYSPSGEVLWTWSSNKYVQDEDILKVGQKVGVGNTFGHMNSFYFDEKAGIVYAGFRDLNCILAIEKESGKVLQSYGDKIPSDTTTQGIGFFKKQHAPIKLPSNRLLLFNNNDRKAVSSVQIMSEVTDKNPKANIEWEFLCDFDTLMPSSAGRMGNVLPIENEHILVNMGQVARIFEVNPKKEVVWQCLPETWNEATESWKPRRNYRVFQASSLYPYYHTVSLREESIEISNEGSEDDVYSILVYLKPRKRKKATEIIVQVESGASVSMKLSEILSKRFKSKTVFVEVQSGNNPDRVVERSYLIK